MMRSQVSVGKGFFTDFSKFLVTVHPETIWMEWSRSIATTDPSGDCQPGALEIILTDQLTRQSETTLQGSSEKTIRGELPTTFCLIITTECTACIVGEIKSDEMEAESQNIEQMVGLFRKNQYAMLGFTCNPSFISPRVLIQHGSVLLLYNLPTLSLEVEDYQGSLLALAKLFIAFTSVVNIAL